MAKRKRFWAVCCGHVCRWAQALTASEAVYDAFGIHPNRWHAPRITVREFPSNPKYMPLYKRNAFLEALFARHKETTGIEIK